MVRAAQGLLSPVPDRITGRTAPNRGVGAAASAIYPTAPQSAVHGAADCRQAEQLSGRFERAGGEYAVPAGRANGRPRGSDRTAQGAGSNAMGTADEQYPEQSNGGGEQRFDLHIRYRRRGAIPAVFGPAQTIC